MMDDIYIFHYDGWLPIFYLNITSFTIKAYDISYTFLSFCIQDYKPIKKMN